MIPKRLLLTHVSEHSLEPKLRYCMQRMKDLHPDWEFLFFSDGDCREFIRKEAPEFMELYDWYPKAVMRADLFRLLVVHRLGGFYLDTDMLLESSLDPLVEHSAVFTIEEQMTVQYVRRRFPRWMWHMGGQWSIANYAFAAEKGHPYVGAVLDQVVARTADFDIEDCSSLDILHSTGPDAVTAAYYREPERWKDVTILNVPGCRFGVHGQHLVHSIWWEGF
jgi:mannosyltransferase OCH1-like enzyme